MYRLVLLMTLQDGTAVVESDQGSDPTRAYLTVLVPAGGKLYVDGQPSPCGDALDTHAFRTPPIEPGRRYCYVLRVEMAQEDSPWSVCRWVYFSAGETPTVDFRDASRSVKELAPKMSTKRGAADPADRPVMPPALPDTRPPRQALAGMTDKGDIEIASVEFSAVPYTETRKRVVDGKEELYTVTAYKWLPEERTRKLHLKEIGAFDVTGRPIGADELARLLRYRTVVALTPDGRVDPFYRQSMKDETVILAVPDSQVGRAIELELPHAIPGAGEKVPPMPPAAP